MRLVNNKEYPTFELDKLFQCNLSGGTASLLVRTAGAPNYVKIKEFDTDELVKVSLPNGQYKVELTGSATVAVSQ